MLVSAVGDETAGAGFGRYRRQSQVNRPDLPLPTSSGGANKSLPSLAKILHWQGAGFEALPALFDLQGMRRGSAGLRTSSVVALASDYPITELREEPVG